MSYMKYISEADKLNSSDSPGVEMLKNPKTPSNQDSEESDSFVYQETPVEKHKKNTLK